MEEELCKMKDEKSWEKLENKVSLMESEVIDLKNQRKNNVKTNLVMDATPDYFEKFDILVDEVNSLWSFLQRYIDEQVVDAIIEIRSPDNSYRDKMNEMEWLARNAEFLSPDAITKCLMAFKELYNPTN